MNTTEILTTVVELFEEVGAVSCVEDNIVVSNGTLADFIGWWGKPDFINTNGVYEWLNLQTRKGAVRGNLVVVEIDGVAYTYFGGEA